MNLITDLDQAVENRIKFLENKFNCLIFIEADDTNYYMNVAYKDMSGFESEIYLCKKSESKYTLASAIRSHFIKN